MRLGRSVLEPTFRYPTQHLFTSQEVGAADQHIQSRVLAPLYVCLLESFQKHSAIYPARFTTPALVTLYHFDFGCSRERFASEFGGEHILETLHPKLNFYHLPQWQLQCSFPYPSCLSAFSLQVRGGSKSVQLDINLLCSFFCCSRFPALALVCDTVYWHCV